MARHGKTRRKLNRVPTVSPTVSAYCPLPPQPLKTGRIAGCVFHGVRDLTVPQVILNQAGIRALIGQSKAAAMAQHVRASVQRQGGRCAVFSEQQIDSRAVQRFALAAYKERFVLHPSGKPPR